MLYDSVEVATRHFPWLVYNSNGSIMYACTHIHLGPFLVTWINLNPTMNIHHEMWDEISYPFTSFKVAPLKFILHINVHVITYTCRDYT